jgi:hypothetical protein
MQINPINIFAVNQADVIKTERQDRFGVNPILSIFRKISTLQRCAALQQQVDAPQIGSKPSPLCAECLEALSQTILKKFLAPYTLSIFYLWNSESVSNFEHPYLGNGLSYRFDLKNIVNDIEFATIYSSRKIFVSCTRNPLAWGRKFFQKHIFRKLSGRNFFKLQRNGMKLCTFI